MPHKEDLSDETKNKISEKDAYNTAWEYFKFHAQQRLTYLNYFIAFSVALTSAQIGILSANIGLQYIGIFIGIAQIFLAFIFIKIDKRNTFLTKLSENILREFEKFYSFSNNDEYLNSVKIFTIEEQESSKVKMMSHRKTYKAIMLTFLVVGVDSTIAAIILTILANIA